MIIDRANNTSAIPGLQSQQPQASLRKGGLMGLGQEAPNPADANSWQEIVGGVNSELLYLINIDRLQSGKTPIPAEHAAPSVNVGLTPETRNVALLAGAGILGLILLAKRSR